MSVGVLDLTYGRTLKPDLTPTIIPISTSAFLNGVSVNGNSFSFGTVGNYQCQLSVDADFGPDNSSRIIIDVYNSTLGVSLDSFNIDGSSGDTSWPLCFAVTNIAHVFQIRAVTFSTATGTIKAVRIIATDLDPAASGGGGGIVITSVQLPLEFGTVGAGILSLGTATGPTTPDPLSAAIWSSATANECPLALQAKASQATSVFQIQTSDGVVVNEIWIGSATYSGGGNTNLGAGAGFSLTSGANNTAIGGDAGRLVSSGGQNTSLGNAALSSLLIGDYNTGLGFGAGSSNTASQNTFVGGSSGGANVSGTGQAFFGYQSGTLVTGNDNTIFGHRAGDGFTTGIRNCLFGKDAGGAAAATSMSDTSMFGYQAGILNTAVENSYFGSLCGWSNVSGTGQTFMGYRAGVLCTGSNNTIIGNDAGDGLTTGTGNVLVGGNAGGAGTSGAMSNTVMMGFNAGLLNTANENVFIGSSSGAANTSGTGQVIIGYQAGDAITGTNNTVVGYQSCTDATGGFVSSFGFQSGFTLTSGVRNVFLGSYAGYGTTTGSDGVYVGHQAGANAVAAGSSDVVFVGANAGLINTANQNTFIGSNSGDVNTSGTGQTFVGYNSGTNVTGSNNSIFGHQAGDGFTTGARNCLFGKDAGGASGATAMSDAVMIGYQAGLLNTASNATFIGSGSGAANTSGTQQTFVGYNTGLAVTGSGNTILGYNAGAGTLTTGGSNVLIGNNADTISSSSSNAVAIGSGSVAGSNQFVSVNINDVFFGTGVVNSSATAYTVNGCGGFGTDNAGAALQLAGGKGTGTAAPGLVVLKYPLKTTTGTTLQSLSTQSFPVSTTMFTGNTTDVTVTASVVNTTETTLLGSPSAGSVSLEGGLLRVGRVIKFRVAGTITSAGVGVTYRFRFKKGSVAMADFGPAGFTAAANTATGFVFEGEILVRTLGASGTTSCTYTFVMFDNAGVAYVRSGITTSTIDTTATENIDATVQYSTNTAGYSTTVNTTSCQILN